MQQIEKALAKAREQRKSLAGDESARVGESRALVRRPRRIVYEATRIEKVPLNTLRENRVVAGLSQSSEADLFRVLRTQVLQRLSARGDNTLGVTSPNAEEGKTLVAVNLAVSLALDVNRTVLLVDLDLRRPSIPDYFGLTVEQGLTDYLFDRAPLSDCLINPGIERLVLLPSGRPMRNSSEALSSPSMVDLARELKARYPDRLVIYDMPPLLASDDSLVFLPQIDASLLVVQEGKTSADDIQRALDLLDGENLLGTVLNRSAEQGFSSYH